MILMAIDHVRVFSGIPAGGPSPAIFFTRWVTHFCAPLFIFLAGTSSFFYGRKHPDLSRFLLLRGLWLILLELTVLRVAWTFNFDFAGYEMAGVIWAIGWCMILIAGLVKLPIQVTGAIGVAIVGGHNLLDSYVQSLLPTLGNDVTSSLWKIIYVAFFAGPITFGESGPSLIVLYSIVPWIGVMAAGYAFGRILQLEAAKRNQYCLLIGLGSIILFVILRMLNLYGDPRPWAAPPPEGGLPAALSFFNATKYPASLLFLLMTLGPAIALIPYLERLRSRIVDGIALFGKAPFFFYLLHIPLIHALALATSLITTGEVSPWLFLNHPMGSPPPPNGYTWSLGMLYLNWAIAIGILYPACNWFFNIKATRRSWWLRFL